jgi:pimeloyl-ACP methyl ester carboxylesterase
MRSLVLVSLALAASVSQQNGSAPSAACTTATERCTEWVALGRGPARSLIYRTRSLEVRNDGVRRALIMVHGTNRNADHYFSTAVAASFLAGALDDSVVISPRIASAAGNCHDTLAPNEVSWSCTGDSWRSGGSAASHPDLTSFDFVDQILKKLASKNVFPNLRTIVVAGHSAGGQFVARYQMANRVHDTLGVAVSYVVANPSSYAWPDSTRPQPVDDAAPENAKGAWETEKVHTRPVRRVKVRELQPLAGRPRRTFGRLHGNDQRRAAEETAGLPADDVSVRPGRHAAARRLRLVVPGDGAGRNAPRPRRSVREVHQREARRETRGADRVRVRPQRPLRLHDRRGAAGDLPARAIRVGFKITGGLL